MSVIAERREKQREQLVDAAERQIASAGMASLKVRDLTQQVGISLGAIYNHVADLDELIMRVIVRSLNRLDEALKAATPPDPAQPADVLVALAQAYRGFASEHLLLWRAMFEHRPPAGQDVPEWLAEAQLRLFRHIEAPLAAQLPRLHPEQRTLFARTLFSAVHGVVALGLEEKLVAVPVAELDRQLERLVRVVVHGLASGG
jgi:AcrR family transcriptional regulator